MIRRGPKATKPAKYFADKFGLSPRTIKRWADRYGWKKTTYGTGPTATVFLFEQEVNRFFEQKQQNTF
jgi:uncharacterized protein YjcR